MTNAFNNEVNIGDVVAYVDYSTGTMMKKGTVTKLTPKGVSIGKYLSKKSCQIAKITEQESVA